MRRPTSSAGHPRLYRFLTSSPLAVGVTRNPRFKQLAVRMLRIKTRVSRSIGRVTGSGR